MRKKDNIDRERGRDTHALFTININNHAYAQSYWAQSIIIHHDYSIHA